MDSQKKQKRKYISGIAAMTAGQILVIFIIIISIFIIRTATSKPEVLTTLAVGKIETRFRRLYLGFRGRPEEWSIDRQRNVHARYRI